MIQTFLRGPRGPAELFADGVRVLGLLGIAVAFVGWDAIDVAIVALAALGLLVPRALGVRPALDVAFGVAVIVASWSALLNVYDALVYWDLIVHCVLNGLIAALLYILAVRLSVVPDPGRTPVRLGAIVVLTTSFGLAAGVVWEIAEWFGNSYIDPTIFVAYTDTIGDLAAGGLGSLVAGLAGRYLSAQSRFIPSAERETTVRSRPA